VLRYIIFKFRIEQGILPYQFGRMPSFQQLRPRERNWTLRTSSWWHCDGNSRKEKKTGFIKPPKTGLRILFNLTAEEVAGCNQEASRFSGIHVSTDELLVYQFSGKDAETMRKLSEWVLRLKSCMWTPSGEGEVPRSTIASSLYCWRSMHNKT
jgi:hypothetical protein